MAQKRAVLGILSIVFILNATGLVALYSTNLVQHSDIYLKKQIIAMILAWAACYIFAKIPLRILLKYKKFFLRLAFIGLILVLIPGIGRVINGSRRWIQIPGFSLQVSEFAKIPFVIWLAGYLYENEVYREQFVKGFLKPVIVCGSLAFLVLCEPDYGTACLMMGVAFLVLFLLGARLLHLFFLIISGIIAFCGLVLLSPVRLQRITSFFDVEGHRFDATYQLWQGILCFASGGMSGVGIGLGRQKLSYLPESHTDFIFPVIGEEFGGTFAIFIIFCFLTLLFITFFSLYPKQNRFIQALGYGAILVIVLQGIINIAVVTGCVPTKGMALPFISYGGSNLIAMYSLIGLVINCICAKDFASYSIKTYTRDIPFY